ncbi:MAG TPA: hypothetical protein VG962_02820 [Steroidobacteraceae bacterium]|nr:hypothetical protein [Steroidobacteraceae bacterium]
MMAFKTRFFMTAICMALTACITSPLAAETNSAARVQAMSKLPDWSGVWIATGTHKTLDPSGKPPPYNDEWRKKYVAQRKEKHWSKQDSLERTCVAGVPRLLGSQYPFVFVITPEEVLIHYAHREVRHIYTDGRDHPPVDELWPNAWGMSIGHWEGQTLVISTVSTQPDLWIDSTGAKLSAQVEIIERISAINEWHLKNDITINDPESLSKPWKFTRYYRRTLGTDIEDEQCNFSAIKKAQ